MDNNVLASKEFPQIIQDLIDCGFGKGAMFTPPNQLEIAIRNLKKGINETPRSVRSFHACKVTKRNRS